MINVAVVGTGALGSLHAANFAQIDGCRVKRVYDIVAENAENCAEPLGAEVASDFDQCLADDIDAIAVVTPTDVHAQYCIRAAQAGKHIFCEKPMARTVDEADQVVAAVEAAGVKMMVGHVLRFFPEYQTARQMIQEGQLGNVGMIRMARINLMPGDWYGDLQRSGGVILDMIIHESMLTDCMSKCLPWTMHCALSGLRRGLLALWKARGQMQAGFGPALR